MKERTSFFHNFQIDPEKRKRWNGKERTCFVYRLHAEVDRHWINYPRFDSTANKPPCDRYSIFATTRWHVYGNIRDVVTRRPNIRPGPWTFQLIIQRVDLNKSTDQSPIFLTLFIRFSANRARNLSLAPNVFHAIPRPINKTRPSHAPFVRFPCGFRGKKEKTKKREKEKTWRFDLQYFPNWPHFALRFPLRGIMDRQIILAASLENFQVYLEEGIVIIGCDNSADGGTVRVRDPRSIFFRGEKSVARSSHGTRVFFNYQRLNGW